MLWTEIPKYSTSTSKLYFSTVTDYMYLVTFYQLFQVNAACLTLPLEVVHAVRQSSRHTV